MLIKRNYQDSYLIQLKDDAKYILEAGDELSSKKAKGVIVGGIFYKATNLEVLLQLPGFEVLNLESNKVSDFSVLNKLSKLKTLFISEKTKGVVDVKIQGLEVLNTSFANIKSISEIVSLKKLRLINFKGDNNLFSKLSELESLTVPNFKSNTKNLEGISLKKLKYLDINGSNITSLIGIEKFDSLKHLKLIRCRNLLDVSHLLKLKNIRQIEIESCNNIENIYLLKDLGVKVFQYIFKGKVYGRDELQQFVVMSDHKNLSLPTDNWIERLNDGDDTFSMEAIKASQNILLKYVEAIKRINSPSETSLLDLLKLAIFELNEITNSDSTFGSFIETQEREELVDFFEQSLSQLGFNFDYDVTEAWREW